MFFIFSKIITPLLAPLPVFLGIGIILYKLRQKTGKKLLFIWITVFYMLSLPIVSNFVVSVFEKKADYEKDKIYDAVVVLGGAVIPYGLTCANNEEFNDAADRIITGINIMKKGTAKNLLISGGGSYLGNPDFSEAVFLKDFAEKSGVSREKIFIEKNSKNTFENALFSGNILKELGFEKILLITSAFHMRRAQLCFRKQGIEADILPADYRKIYTPYLSAVVPSEWSLVNMRIIMKEIVGIVIYKIKGYI